MKAIWISLGVLAIFLVIFLFYEGVFSPVKLEEKMAGGYWVVYQGHVGPYEKVEPVIKKIKKSLKADGIKPKAAFGLYYDNPAEVAKEKLRSEVGIILGEDYYSKIGELRAKYNLKQVRNRKSLVTVFPWRNFLSFMVGPMKVYPAMDKYCKAKKIDAKKIKDSYGLEIYDCKNKKIIYIMPVE